MAKQTIGGQRLGSGNKMEVDLKTYERSTHNLSNLWRSTIASGTLVPFMVELALPADTFDINLDCQMMTLPTIGPLFGSYKVQLDVFECPIRLYHGALNNNKLGIGLDMANIKLPQMSILGRPLDVNKNLDNQQINPSALLSYLNIRGVGNPTDSPQYREFSALSFLSYWDIYKNYYANKQEEKGAFINNALTITNRTLDISVIEAGNYVGQLTTISALNHPVTIKTEVQIRYSGSEEYNPDNIMLQFTDIADAYSSQVFDTIIYNTGYITLKGAKTAYLTKHLNKYKWQPRATEIVQQEPRVELFDLKNIDDARDELIKQNQNPYVLNKGWAAPFGPSIDADTIDTPSATTPLMCSQQGLGIKTYQSDLFNNWMKTDWIDGTNGISEITSVDTSAGSFSIDTLNLSKKVYDMLNRIAISGGTYDDWVRAVYTHEYYNVTTTPVYHGGLIKELVFEEVISNAQATGAEGEQPLGTLAGKGRLSGKNKGGNVTIKVNEPSYIIGIISLTPRIDYSQGTKWDNHLKTMDDFHKPQLDEIGFQDLITEQLAWWDTKWDGEKWVQKSAGKQPAWLNYMTNVNVVRGAFAQEDNQMFMTLNRRYENDGANGIKDLTTYIDPVKFNQIFAQTSRDAQNFWAQIAVNITARRKMSAKIMPNL